MDRSEILSEFEAMFGTSRDEDITAAIEMDNYGDYDDVAAIPLDHPNRFQILKNIGNNLGTRFEYEGSVEDLHHAIEVTEMAIAAMPPEQPAEDQADVLAELGHWHYTMFTHTKSIDSLNRSIQITEQALATLPELENVSERAALQGDLAARLYDRHEESGSIPDLVRAIELTGKAIKATPEWGAYPDRGGLLENLRDWLVQWFEKSGHIDELDTLQLDKLDQTLEQTIEVINTAIEAMPSDHPHLHPLLNNLGTRLLKRFLLTGSMKDLNRAVEVAELAIAAIPPHLRPVALLNLGSQLGARFDLSGSWEDLENGIKATEEALVGITEEHTSRWKILSNLAHQLSRRFERTSSEEDLNRAVETSELALKAARGQDVVTCLIHLGTSLNRRFQHAGVISDIDRAIQVTEEAVAATPTTNYERASWLHNLGASLGSRFEKTGLRKDLDQAIEYTDMAVSGTSLDHPSFADKAYGLSTLLIWRFRQTNIDQDLEKSLVLCKEGWSSQRSRPSARILSAWRAALILTTRLEWSEADTLLKDAVKLLPAVSPRYLKDDEKQTMISSFSGLASLAAAATLNAGGGGEQALEILELGRGVVNGLLLEMRTDISDLEARYPELAEQFRLRRDALDSPVDVAAHSISSLSDVGVSAASRLNWRHETTQRFDETVETIRAQPGFERFLLPPTADEMRAAAKPGPIVVINISDYRSDAFLVQSHQITVLELPNLSVESAEEHAKQIRLGRQSGAPRQTRATLEWLWDVAAKPILKRLQFEIHPAEWPRIWWVPTGVISNLPIHAAGIHAKDSTETVLDRVMSSYSLSIKTLIYARRHSARETLGGGRILLCSMPTTPSQRTLPFAMKEANLVKDLCPSLQLSAIEPPRNKEAILEHLRTSDIFHFAGHGLSNPTKPLQSYLLLDDWSQDPLTVACLRDSRLQAEAPFLSYLSACETGANDASKLVDEGIHLVSACQVAGFRHVVGTLWAASDKHCLDIAKVFYETLRDEGITDRSVCLGLHLAIRALRDIEMTLSHDEMAEERDDRQDAMEDGNGLTEDSNLVHKSTISSLDTINRAHNERNAILIEEDEEVDLLHWIPYVHFGV